MIAGIRFSTNLAIDPEQLSCGAMVGLSNEWSDRSPASRGNGQAHGQVQNVNVGFSRSNSRSAWVHPSSTSRAYAARQRHSAWTNAFLRRRVKKIDKEVRQQHFVIAAQNNRDALVQKAAAWSSSRSNQFVLKSNSGTWLRIAIGKKYGPLPRRHSQQHLNSGSDHPSDLQDVRMRRDRRRGEEVRHRSKTLASPDGTVSHGVF